MTNQELINIVMDFLDAEQEVPEQYIMMLIDRLAEVD